MASARLFVFALLSLVPAAVRAHGPGEGRADPELHVDPSVEDCSVQFASELTQGAFRRFAREFGAVSAFKLMSPPTTLGRWGVGIGLEYIAFTVNDKADAWNDTFAHPDAEHELGSNLAFPKLRARVDITDELDVGAFFTKSFNANYGWLGLEVKYGLLRQSEEMPITLALRGAYTKTLFVEDMDMHAAGADVAAGRTFWGVFTPYLGVGGDFVLARETSDVVELDTEALFAPHLLAGLEVRFWHVTVGAEAQLAVVNSLQAQFGAVF